MKLIKNKIYNINLKVKVLLLEVLTVFKYSKSLPAKSVTQQINYILKKQNNFLKPKATFFLTDIEVEKKLANIKFNGTNFVSKKLFKVLKKAKLSLLFVTTVGKEISNLSNQALKEKDYFTGLVYDTIGSIAVEKCAQEVQKLTQKFAKNNNLQITQRFSPGYGDWHLSEQKKIFKILKPENIGIYLTKNFMMQPEKSVSAIIGIGNNLGKICASICLTCKVVNCPYKN